jgi:creatinine amidohydrolase
MTKYFAFDELTWPEVEALPHDIPLVLPFGNLDGLDSLTTALENPNRVGILPAVPFGWQGSGLDIHGNLFDRMLDNLLAGLKEDGFNDVYNIAPAYECVGPHIKMLPEDDNQGKVIVIPIGHTEQHGFHLPLSTDTLIIDAIAKGVVSAIPEKAVALPVMPYGVSTHRKSFPGTFNVGGRAFEDFWLGIIDNLVNRGYDRYYFLSGHGGNCSFLTNVVKYAGERHRRIFCATSWLYLSGPDGIAALQARRSSILGGMGHACELETSLLLHLRPELVKKEKAVDEIDFISTPSYYMDWVEGGALVANPPWEDDSATGAYGAGSLGDSQKGKAWLEAAVLEKVAHVNEIHEQQDRREERRRQGWGRWSQNRSWGEKAAI